MIKKYQEKLFIVVCFSVFSVLAKSQTTYTVVNTNDSGIGSLRNAASNAASGDIINFMPSLIGSGNATISLNSEIDFGNKSITINGLYNSSDTLFVSGSNNSRIFSFNGAGKVVIDSLALINGNGTGINNNGDGGAILYLEGTDTIHINYSLISGNTCSNFGSAIFSYSANTASSVTSNNSSFINNSCIAGGGIYSYSIFGQTSVEVYNCSFTGNSVSANGGGVYSESFGSSSTILSVNSTFDANNADYGGALFSNASAGASISSIEAINSTFNQNSAQFGGGVYSNSYGSASIIAITNSTFLSNTGALGGGGLHCQSVTSTTSVASVSSIFIGSSINNQSVNSVSSGGYNIFSDSPVGANSTGDFTNISLTLGPLAYNGGNTKTLLPDLGSVAINSGNPLDLIDAQNGLIFGVRDIGAAEHCGSVSSQSNMSCSSFNWATGDGLTYTNDTTVSHVFPNANLNGCDSLVKLDLTINNPSTGVDVQTVCDSLIWIDGNTYSSSNNSATYTLVNSVGCDSIVTLDLMVNSTPDVSTTQSDGINLSAVESGMLYQWIDCNDNYSIISGATNQTYTANMNGSFAVIVNNSGCSDTSLCLTVENVSVETHSIEFQIFPNPAYDLVNVTVIYGNQIEYFVSIFNLSGQMVASKLITKEENLIDVSHLDKGLYFLEVSCRQGYRRLQLIKE